jgi:radical SAM protein with 4Fe4S-binding SPASM domain
MIIVNDDATVVPISQLPLWEKTQKNRTLLSVTLEITARCNNDCVHCYINLPSGDAAAIEKELSTEEIKALVDESVSMGALWFLLTGGEPLLRDDFIDIYMYIKKKGVLVSLFTNATLISNEHIKLFKRYPPREIEVTVYGVTRQTHEKVTGKKYFSATMSGIDRLINAALPVTLKSTILRSNYMEFNEISKYCQRKSFHPFRFDPLLQFRVDRDTARNQKIRIERLTADEIIQIENADEIRRDALLRLCTDMGSRPVFNGSSSQLFRCKAGINSCCIGYDGVFKLCSALANPACTYSLITGSLTDAWNNFAPLLRKMESAKPSFQDKCGKCGIIDWCMWCPAHADLETGKLDEYVPFFCDIAEKRKNFFDSIV